MNFDRHTNASFLRLPPRLPPLTTQTTPPVATQTTGPHNIKSYGRGQALLVFQGDPSLARSKTDVLLCYTMFKLLTAAMCAFSVQQCTRGEITMVLDTN